MKFLAYLALIFSETRGANSGNDDCFSASVCEARLEKNNDDTNGKT